MPNVPKYIVKPEYIKTIHSQLNLLNYISSASLYLKGNHFEPSKITHDDIKPRILGHWGTVPGLNLIYACTNALIKDTNQKTIFVTGPGHGAPANWSNLYLEGSLVDFYPQMPRNREGAINLIHDFSWPKRLPSHAYPGCPGSIHEGGELGYSLGTAYGMMFDNPDWMALTVIGDGEAETGALAASWHSNKFYNPITDGYVLPILHVNGYKISNPTIFSTMSDEEITSHFSGLGYKVIHVSQYTKGDIVDKTINSLYEAYEMLELLRSTWKPGDKVIMPLIVLRTMKGWTGPKFLGEKKIEDNNYSHGIPIKNPKTVPSELEIIRTWLQSYNPSEFFDSKGNLDPKYLLTIPKPSLCMGNALIAQRIDPKPLALPDLELVAAHNSRKVGKLLNSELAVFSQYLELMLKDKSNLDMFRIFSPDESESNFLEAIFNSTDKVYQWPVREWDKDIDHKGHFMEILSEQTLQSWMQGYILTGRHGVFISYEAFFSIIASQIDQYIKFIRQAQDFAWRSKVPSMNYIATSSVWRQDHNGFTHQNPILINTLLSKHVDFVNVYFPCDVNTMLVIMEEAFQSLSHINLIIAGKTQMPQWLTLSQARKQIEEGCMVWDFATNSDNPDVVLSSAGDYMTMEMMAGIDLINQICPELKYRYVNISDLTCTGFGCSSKRCLTDKELCKLYTEDKPIIFNFHGYPEVLKQLLFDTCLAGRSQVRGYIEKGTTTTPFDMQIKNLTSRYHIAIAMIQESSKVNKAVEAKSKEAITYLESKISKHKLYIEEIGDDMDEIKNWVFGGMGEKNGWDNSNQ
jgi:xylulose-5-phosphate/fructose-6-phosphate phosphoketolase